MGRLFSFSPRISLRVVLLLSWLQAAVHAAPPTETAQTDATAKSQQTQTFYIRKYRVAGAHILSPLEIGKIVYPFLGPERTVQDVEQARQALEKAYQEKGYQAVSVQIPQQQVKNGLVVLQVTEGVVGRVRVTGSRYFLPSEIKKRVPSLEEGKPANFNDVSNEILALNQLPDRQVTPTFHPGGAPGTVDIDLNVKDTLPLHGSLELNDRYSANTTKLRVNGSVSYNNLWQLDHSAGFSFQLAPENLDDGEVFSGYYIVRFASVPWLSLLAQGTWQNSDVSTLGGSAVAGRGQTAGTRFIFTLPQQKNFYQSASVGLDYKHYDQDLDISGSHIATPTTYFPLTASYNANWVEKGSSTELNVSLNLGLRGLGSDLEELGNSRYKTDGNYIYVRGDLSHTHDLPGGVQVYAKVQGQVADQPLLNNEQIAGGGLDTVRGYLESAVVGDNGIFGTVELRSPSLGKFFGKPVDDWRVYLFGDAGMVSVINPLAEQDDKFRLASFGIGTRVRLLKHFSGSLDIGVPLIGQGSTSPYDPLFTFRLWTEF